MQESNEIGEKKTDKKKNYDKIIERKKKKVI
jgi:hypothetical protein